MPSSDPARRLLDIIANIDRITAYIAGMDRSAFAEDTKTVDAVERCLQRITEAAIKLQPNGALLLPHQDWDAMRGFGNVLRHEYDRISHDIIWDVVADDLPQLRQDCEAALKRLAP
jgi:uncharacterized protein with HEPN domain